jgi:hypothetical protein
VFGTSTRFSGWRFFELLTSTRLVVDFADATLAWSIDLIDPTFFYSCSPELYRLLYRFSFRLPVSFTFMKGKK